MQNDLSEIKLENSRHDPSNERSLPKIIHLWEFDDYLTLVIGLRYEFIKSIKPFSAFHAAGLLAKPSFEDTACIYLFLYLSKHEIDIRRHSLGSRIAFQGILLYLVQESVFWTEYWIAQITLTNLAGSKARKERIRIMRERRRYACCRFETSQPSLIISDSFGG